MEDAEGETLAQHMKGNRREQTDIRDYFQPLTQTLSPTSSHPCKSETCGHVRIDWDNSSRDVKTPYHEPSGLSPKDCCPNSSDHQSAMTQKKVLRNGSYSEPVLLPTSTNRTLTPSNPLRPITIIDPSMLPKPLKLKTNINNEAATHDDFGHDTDPSLGAESIVVSAAIGTERSFRRSRILSIFEKQSLGLDQSFSKVSLEPTLNNRHCRQQDIDALMADEQQKNPEEDDTVIYFLPVSTSLRQNARSKDQWTYSKPLPKPASRRGYSVDDDVNAFCERHKPISTNRSEKGYDLKGHGRNPVHLRSHSEGTPKNRPCPRHVNIKRDGIPNTPRIATPMPPQRFTKHNINDQRRIPANESPRPQHRRTQSESAASGIPNHNKDKGGRMARLVRKYAKHVEGL